MISDRAASTATSNLTQTQQLLWVGQALNPGVPLYNMVQTFRIKGRLDVSTFVDAWRRVVDASDALRTSIEDMDGVPHQRVASSVDFDVAVVDFSRRAQPQAAAEVWLDDRRSRPFELQDLLFECAVLRIAPEDHIWYLAQHHLITDGHAFALAFLETERTYAALIAGNKPTLELPLFGDFVDAERKYRESDTGRANRDRWADRIAVDAGSAEFYGRRANGSVEFDRHSLPLGSDRCEALRTIASMPAFKSLSVDMSLHAIWAAITMTLLHRITGLTRLRIGTPFHGRSTRDRRRTIGPLLEIGIIEADVVEHATFDRLVRHLLDEILWGLRNAKPGVSSAALNRSYDVLLNNVTAKMTRFAGMEVETAWLHSGFGDAEQPLRVQVTDFDGSGDFTVLFETNRYVFGTHERGWITDQFLSVVDAFVQDPTGLIGGFALVDQGTASKQRVEFNATEHAAEPGTVVDGFLAQVSDRPDAIAVSQDHRSLSYHELDGLSQRLATRLRAAEIGRGDTVGVCMTRSLESVLAILAVIRSGATYLPLEVSDPARRLRDTLSDSGAIACFVDLSDVGLPTANDPVTGDVDLWAVDIESIGADRAPAPLPRPSPDDIVYLIYTSGSTGRPKGAEILHSGLHNYISWAARTYQPTGPRSFALYSSLAFDLTITSIFTPLVSGARIVVYEPSAERPGLEILDVMNDDAVQVVKLTPAHLNLVLAAEILPSRLEAIIVGGENFQTDLANRAQQFLGSHVEIYNEYGPTETVVGCMVHRFDPRTDMGPSVPIGSPADNSRIYVVDGYDQPVPSGVEGEMLVAGAGVAQGYRGRRSLTDERFGVDPFHPAERVYRTGDVARWGRDDRLEFLGRRDDQVKYRGARIELGEIEAAALDHPRVESATGHMVDNDGPTGPEKGLVVYVTTKRGASTDGLERDVSKHLAEALPVAMRPDAVIHLDEVPLTRNGKVDRGQLPRPLGAPAPSAADRPAQPPANETERRLAEVWAAIFDLQSVDTAANFFDLGGDSITAIRLVSAARNRGLAIAPRDIFRAQTIVALASLVDAAASNNTVDALDAANLVEAKPTREAATILSRQLGIAVRDIQDIHPLSPAQLGILYHGLRNPASEIYHQQTVARLPASTDHRLLHESFNLLVSRHGGLRSLFVWANLDEPQQVVLTHAKVAWQYFDWGDRSTTQCAREIEHHRAQNRATRFALDREVPYKVSLVRTAKDCHLTIDGHHLLLDGWSNQLLLGELVAIYSSLVSGVPDGLRNAPQFGEFSRWLEVQDQEDVRSYWEQRLEGLETFSRLAISTTSSSNDLAYSRRSHSVDASTVESLTAFATANRLTVNTLVEGAWALALARYSGSMDVVFGTTVSGRPDSLAEAGEMVGMFVNTIPTRVKCSPDESLGTWLARLQTTQVEARHYSHVSLADVQKLAGFPAGESLFDTLLVFERVPGAAANETASALPIHDIDYREQSNFGFALLVFPGAEIELRAIVDSNQYSDLAVDRLLGHVAELLRQFGANHDRQIRKYTMTSAAESSELVEMASGPPLPNARDDFIHEAFERHAGATPAAIAIATRDGKVTYGELDSWATDVAVALRDSGLVRGDHVLVAARSEPAQVAAILGVLKAGGAYVPVDSKVPDVRLKQICDDTNAKVALGLDVACLSTVKQLDPRTVRSSQVHRRHNQPPDRRDRTSRDNAYVIYTSGSTGRPKGVVLRHSNIVASTLARGETYGDRDVGRFLLLSSFAFDSSMVGLWWTLSTGATLVLPDPLDGLALLELGSLISSCEVSDMLALPSLYEALIESVPVEQLTSLRRVIVAGETCPPRLVAAHQQLAPAAQLYNEYGPTEAAVWSHVERLDLVDESVTVPIGLPIAGTTGLILDQFGSLAPLGVPGELVLGGPGVARGYLKRPELTTERFVTLAPSGRTAERFYCTGDLVKRVDSSKLEFLGRVDRQVKIRGFRVELEEVEAALLAIPAVTEAAVVVARSAAGSNHLVGFVTGPSPDDASFLRESLESSLPAYMVPSRVSALASFPRTATGKIDRASLRPVEPEADRPTFAPARTADEHLLLDIWRAVLSAPALGIDDDFFEAGGHSLTALRLFARINKEATVELPLSTLFEAPTVRLLARHLRAGNECARGGSSLVAISSTGDRRPFFYVSPYEISVLELNKLARHFPDDRPFYGLQPAGLVVGEQPHDTIRAMAEHYVDLIADVQPIGPYALGGHCDGGWVAYEMARLLRSRGHEVSYLGLVEIPPPYELQESKSGVAYIVRRSWYFVSDGRLLKAALWQFKLRWQRHVLAKVGRQESRLVATMRDANGRAFRDYQFVYDYDGPVSFVQSTEGAAVKWLTQWYVHLSEHTSTTPRFDVVDSTHANLLREPESQRVAAALIAGLESSEQI